MAHSTVICGGEAFKIGGYLVGNDLLVAQEH